MNARLKFCDNYYMKENQGLVIINNRDLGTWLKLTKECFEIIERAVEQEWSVEKLLNECYDREDREYIKLLLDKLKSLQLVYETNDKEVEKEREINSVTFALTKKCNLKCTHCCVDATMENEENASLDDIKKAIDQILELFPKRLILTGGEPMIRKDFFEIVKYIREKSDVPMELMTNGTLISRENVSVIAKNFQSVAISIDGHNEETCAPVRGKGVFNKVIEAVRLLKNAEVKQISLSCVETRHNVEHYDAFKALCKSLEVECISRRFSPSGRGEDNYEELTGKTIEQVRKDVMGTNQIIKTENNCKESSITTGLNSTVCSVFESSFYVGSDLHVYPCGALYLDEFKGENILAISNIKEYFSKKLYMQTDAYKLYDSILFNNIEPCKNCSINFICNNCPAYVYAYKKLGILSTYCNYRKCEMEQEIW